MKKVNVRAHIRRKPTGGVTPVIRHTRSINTDNIDELMAKNKLKKAEVDLDKINDIVYDVVSDSLSEHGSNVDYNLLWEDVVARLQKEGISYEDIDLDTIISDTKDSILSDDRAEPSATFDKDGDMGSIGAYHNDTEGDIELKWVKTDPWRGYYDSYAPAGSDYVKIHDDVILAYSDDAVELKKFDDEVNAAFSNQGISRIRVFPRTSNVFSTGYDLYVDKKDKVKAESIIKKLSEKYKR